MSSDQLPEGTDQIIEGAGFSGAPEDVLDNERGPGGSAEASGSSQPREGADPRTAFFGKFEELRGQATDRARDIAQTGKDRATDAIDNLVTYVEDAAGEIDARVGSQYGDYARRAAEGLGGFSDALRDKDVDALFAEARDLVRKSPAVAVGTAAALGFVVARLLKAGIADPGNDQSKNA